MNSRGWWEAGEPTWEFGFLRTYSIVIFIGMILAFITIAYFWRRQKYSWENLQILLIIVIPSAIIGSRFYTVIFDGGWSSFFRFQGLSIYGGVLFGGLGGGIYLFFRRHTINFRIAFGMIMPAILIGQSIGRWGNFDNHEVYGKIVDGNSLNWLTFIKPHMYIIGPGDVYPAYRAPLFFYESMLSLLGYLIIVWVILDRNYCKPGVTGAFYLIYYGLIRLILQTQRDPDPMNTSYIGNSHVPLNLVVSILCLIVGTFLTLMWQFDWGISFSIKNKKIILFPKRIYKLIKPKKEVHRFWIFKKYERTFRIWTLPAAKKWSKREINMNKKRNLNE